MKLRKIISLVLAVIMTAFTAASCGQTEPVPEKDEKYTAHLTAADGTELDVLCDRSFDDANIVLQFGLLSDLHQNENGAQSNKDKLKTALETIRNLAGEKLDLIACAGDITDSASSGQLAQFKRIYESVLDPETVPFVYCMGNHDAGNDTYTSIGNFQTWLGESYFKTDVDAESLKKGNRHCVIGGFHFIALMPHTFSSYGEAVFSSETLEWLDKTLSEISASDPTKPVFILSHAMPYDTCYGSLLKTGAAETSLGWYTKDLTPVLEKYSQVFTFSGHLHFPLNDERSIMQTAFTAVGCGSTRYMAIENGGYEHMSSGTVMADAAEYSQGLLVSVDGEGNVRFLRLDFYNGGIIKTAWVVPAPKADGSHLTAYSADRRENPAPSFEGASYSVSAFSQTSNSITPQITFDAPTDDDLVHDYIITIENTKTGAVNRTYKLLADFYKHLTPGEMDKTLTQTLKVVIKDNTVYKVKVVARDSWENEGVLEFYIQADIQGGTIGIVPAPEAN